MCYKELGWIETWMNDPKNKAALGVNPERTFVSCNMEVNQAFMLQGDGSHNSAALLPDLINDGIRLLVYAGNAGKWYFAHTGNLILTRPQRCFEDMMCNYMASSSFLRSFLMLTLHDHQ
jgi:hypothetical protein